MNQTHGLHTISIDDRLHRVTVREACTEEVPRSFLHALIARAIAAISLVALCLVVALAAPH